MGTVVRGERPAELQALLDRRRALGQDRFDEVWEGAYHVAPAPNAAHGLVDRRLARLLDRSARSTGLIDTGPFNLGRPEDYRVPDAGYHREEPRGTWVSTAAVVVEIVSPGDETFAKFGFYAAHGVDELLVANPAARQVRIWQLLEGQYVESGRSALLNVTAADLTARLPWPT